MRGKVKQLKRTQIMEEKAVVSKSAEVVLNTLTVRETEVPTLLAQGLRKRKKSPISYMFQTVP